MLAKEKLLAEKERINEENTMKLKMMTEQLQKEFSQKLTNKEEEEKKAMSERKGSKGEKKPEDILKDILERNQNFLRLKL